MKLTPKKARPNNGLPAHWTVADAVSVRGRWLRPDTEFSVTGLRGRLRFVRHISTPTAEWVDCLCKDGRWHSIRVERIRVIHVARRLRGNAA